MATTELSRRWAASLLAIMLTGLPGAATGEAVLIPAHHGELSAGAEASQGDAVHRLMRITKEACFLRGGDAEELRAWAENAHWMPATPAQLGSVPENEFTRVVSGWTVASEFGTTAIIQSEMRPPQEGHVCSVTAQLPTAAQHPDAKAAFQEQFDTSIDEEHDVPDQHTDRFWIERGSQPPVNAMMVFTRSQRMITIRMIHGKAWPLRS